MASLNQALTWYRQARIVMHSLDSVGVFARADEQAVLRLLARAFDAARAQAALLDRETGSSPGKGGRLADEQAKLAAAIRSGEREVKRLKERLRAAPPGQRPTFERASAAASNRLELARARLEFLTRLREFDAPAQDAEDDLEHQIQALQDAVPELRAPNAAQGVAAGSSTDAVPGAWALVQRLLALQRNRSSLEELRLTTDTLTRSVDDDLRTVRTGLKPVLGRLRALAGDPGVAGSSLAESQREFRNLLERRKLLAAVILPMREESALAHRYAGDLQVWKGALDRESRRALQGLALDLVGVVVALAIVLVGGVLWRLAVVRYVADASRRRLLLIVRRVVVIVAVTLVLVFHFTSEIAALVTVLGFAAAGIAFALQNVILAVAGYFTMVAPNGIRVGDRVSLQGPFGYVHGEVMEIGFVRVKLRELAGEPLQPTGRVVVFPNSVVFTGSFYKDPPATPAG